MKGVNREPGDPNYDLFKLALRSTAQRLYPNYANVDWSGNAGYDVNDPVPISLRWDVELPMDTILTVLGQRKDGRGNICPVTIHSAYFGNGNLQESYHGEDELVEKFMELLDQKKKFTKPKICLIERFNWICSQNPASARLCMRMV